MVKLLCYGDSNTYGYDPRSPFGERYAAEHRWVDRLAGMLGCECINAGENGREIPVREWESRYFDQLLKTHQPDCAIIMLGSNDLLQGCPVESVVIRMERFLEKRDKSKTLLVAPPPMQWGEWVTTQELINSSSELGCAYKALSERLGIAFADAGDWNITLAYDGVHFSEEGHRAFAEGLANYFRNRREGLCWKLE